MHESSYQSMKDFMDKHLDEKSELKMRLSDDTLELAHHAADHGFIASEAIDMIIADIEQSKRESMQ